MAGPVQPIVLTSKAGIKRDGTRFEGDYYTDAQWCRFQRGLPRKIGGYRSINKTLSELSRGFGTFAETGLTYCHSGSASKLERFTIDANKNSSVISDRTPVGLTANTYNKWMFQFQGDASSTATNIIAHVAPNGQFLDNAGGGAIYIGDVLGTSALTSVALPAGGNASGGIVSLHPYLFYYGNGGIIGHSVAGDPGDLTGAGFQIYRPWGKKIVKGMPVRSGGSGPSGIFWALDAVIRTTFVGGSTIFQNDVIATDTSILSADGVVDYDGVFYWAGVDRFLMFNGVVREVPNTLNVNWFFDGINPNQTTKVFAFKVPRYGEIWWCYPRGQAEECTHAVIYNVRENTWYDTQLPADMRSAGAFSNGFAAPILMGASEPVNVWIHEQGMDAINGQSILPIESYFETCDFSPSILKGTNNTMRVERIEPDFVQVGNMSVQITGRANARAPEATDGPVSFPEPDETAVLSAQDQTVTLKTQKRQLRVKFTSNEVGGNYQMGQVLMHVGEGDGRVLA